MLFQENNPSINSTALNTASPSLFTIGAGIDVTYGQSTIQGTVADQVTKRSSCG